MKQILQDLKTGQLEIVDLPTPATKPGYLLIQTRCSLISSGTERMLVAFAKSGYIRKALQQPERVNQVLDKLKTEGLVSTINSVNSRLDRALPLGYCNCGVVQEIDRDVGRLRPGDRVVSNGPHSEVVCVSKNLCAKVPDNVSDEQAVFTVPAAIGLQGIRLIKPSYGETVVVFGLGLIGLLCVQLLLRNGCRVLGVDVNKDRLELARKFGARTVDAKHDSDLSKAAIAYSNGDGVDAVLITATAKEDKIMHQAAQMCRKRGRIVLIGQVDLNLSRRDFYEKELTFQVSCSYGPGRYDASYEERGQDYPLSYVRWTAQRNFQAVLESLSAGKLEVSDLIDEFIPQVEAISAYNKLDTDQSKIALILTYPKKRIESPTFVKTPDKFVNTPSVPEVVAGLIGPGNFARNTLMPAIGPLGIRLKTVAGISGVSAYDMARKFGFERATSDYIEVLSDPEINTVLIATRHNLHARIIVEALQHGKHVFVEKPLCITHKELAEINEAYHKTNDRILLVGFNRRFSPHAIKIKSLLVSRNQPVCISILVNSGEIPPDSWVHDKGVGGGRLIGEGCHWIDLMRYWVGWPISSVNACMIGASSVRDICDDKVTVTLSFLDGSIGTLHYFANGHRSYPKETCELFCEGKILRLENFRKLRGHGWSNFRRMNLFCQDKGHAEQFRSFVKRVSNGGEQLLQFEEIENVAEATFAAVKSAQGAGSINI